VPRILQNISLVIVSLFLLTGVGCGEDSPTGTGGSGGGSIRIDGSRVELEGYIERVGDSELTVYGKAVVVTETTELDGEHGEELRFEDLLVGMWVEVRGTLRSDGAVIAERIEVEDDDYTGSERQE
jgi:hypothetical protein